LKLLMITPWGQASITTPATNLKDAMLNLPLFMRPLNGEAVTYRLEPDEPSPYLAVPIGCLLQFEAHRFGLLHGCHSSCDT
jgi:hypothetical protein